MPAYYRALLERFAVASASEVQAILSERNAEASFPLQPEALFAWKRQLPELQNAAAWLLKDVPDSKAWALLLEYPIPRIGKRIDAVLLARDAVIVIELKTGAAPTSAARQVDDYALSLACFHEATASRVVVPLVVADGHTALRREQTSFDHLIEPCCFCSFAEIGPTLARIIFQYESRGNAIDVEAWDRAQFRPIPPIIDAAVALYSNMNVFEIGHSCAAREDLIRTTNRLVGTVSAARAQGHKALCFVTGVPGSGKTLVGLNAVHEREIRSEGSFLSGNGPLVKIIREALVRDVVKRRQVTRREASLTVQTFIQNVHRFADAFQESRDTPKEHVIVFDEAQRAWDLAQSQKAGRNLSEPEMVLQVMDRHSDWAVIIALVGGGQEINRGEAGLEEWGLAVAKFPHWQIIASPQVLLGEIGVSGSRLFNEPHLHQQRLHQDDSLHLKVSVRSIRAEQISDWVNAVLSGDRHQALSVAEALAARPIITRSLSLAKSWLMEKRRGFTRAGLVCSATAMRLRADGLEPSYDFHRRFEWEDWFLDDDNDVRSSSRLEVVATQFEVQGLELDWVGVCWGEDFTWAGNSWASHKFNNRTWTPTKMQTAEQQQRHRHRVNAYRVLLTRARQGMIIYVPQPSLEDGSRLCEALDNTAEYLADCGCISADTAHATRTKAAVIS